MAEAMQAEALDDLHGSAPLRDFVRPAESSGKRYIHHWPGSIGPVTPSLLLAAVAVLLARHTRRRRVTLSWVDANARRQMDLDTPPEALFRDLVGTAVRVAADAPALALDSTTRAPGVTIQFNDHDSADAGPASDLLVRCIRDGAGVHICFDADADLYRPDSVDVLVRQCVHVLTTLGCASEVLLRDVDFMDTAERHRVLRGFNALRADFPRGETLATLIQAQALQRPLAVCAVHGDHTLSFRELESRSNGLARLLQSLGIGPGRFVAVVDRRGLDFDDLEIPIGHGEVLLAP